MNRLTAMIDQCQTKLIGVSFELEEFLNKLDVSGEKIFSIHYGDEDDSWYLNLLAFDAHAIEEWKDFHLAVMDLIAEIDDEDLDAVIETYCR